MHRGEEMDLIKIMKALGDETRIRIINILKDGELCVCEIESLLNINQSNASRHLTKLTNAKIVDYYKKAQYVYYKLDESTLEEYPFLKELLKSELNSIEEYRIDIEKLKEYRKSGLTCDDLKGMKCKE